MATRRYNFTPDRLDAVKLPATGRLVVWDTAPRQLSLRVSRVGGKVFWFTAKALKRVRWIKVGTYPAKAASDAVKRAAIDDARALASAVLARIERGEKPWLDKDALRVEAGTTMAEVWALYLDAYACRHKKPRSVANDAWTWGRILAPWVGARLLTRCPDGHPAAEITWAGKLEHFDQRADAKGHVITGTMRTADQHPCPTCGAMVPAEWTGGKAACDITADMVRALHDRITTDRGAILANRTLALLGTMFSKAAGNLPSPCTSRALGDRVMHAEHGRDRFMSAAELAWFWDGVAHEAAPWPLFFALAATVGARKGNLLALPWPSEKHKEANLATGEWKVPAHKSKGGEAMKLNIPLAICDALREWRKVCPSKVWVFPSPDDPAEHVADPSRAWHRIKVRAETLRLLAVLATAENWTPEYLEAERSGLDELAGRFLNAALGRREASELGPHDRVLADTQERVRQAGGEPSEGTMLDLHFHDIRRSVGAHAAMAGHSEEMIGSLLGHAPGSKATRVYAVIGADHRRRIAAATAATILGHGGAAAGRALKIGGHVS